MTAPNLSPYDLDAIQARVDLIAGFETNRTERDRAALLALVREQQAALDDLMYVANHKAADSEIGRWWAEVIRGPIINHLGAEAASRMGAMHNQAYIVECEDLGPGDQIWFSSLFEAEQTCGPFPSCCVPKPVGDDYDGPKWVPEDDGAALTASHPGTES
jgi:hypothetical protein